MGMLSSIYLSMYMIVVFKLEVAKNSCINDSLCIPETNTAL